MDHGGAIFGVILFIVAIVIALLQAIIAFKRKHAYKWIILVLTLFAWTGIVWVAAFVWAIWPQDKSVIDPVMGNPTGLGRRNIGDTLGGVAYGQERGQIAERDEEARAYQRNPPRSPA